MTTSPAGPDGPVAESPDPDAHAAAVARPGGATARVLRFLRHRWTRRITVAASVVAVSVTGVVIGVRLGGHPPVDVGPFRAKLTVTPALSGETEINIPPLGSLHLNSHDGP